MIDASPMLLMVIMFGSLMVLLLTGLPVVYAMGGIATILVFLVWGPFVAPYVLANTAFHQLSHYNLVAIPLFIFMALILRASGIAEELFLSIRLWFQSVPGGLAMAVVAVSVVIAAMSGVVATGIVVLGIVAVPLMLRLGYSKEMALGPVMAGACLAQLIPPSTGFVIYGSLAQVSIGSLFVGGIVPGLILAGMFTLYIGIRCRLHPELGPPVPVEDRVGWKEKLYSAKGLVLPGLLIAAVLGSIFLGVACATEAAGIGAIGAMFCAVVRRNLTWSAVREACVQTGKSTGMLIWVFFGAACFKSVFVLSGGPHMVSNWVADLTISPLLIVAMMQLIFLFMGCFIQEVVTQLIAMPVFLPAIDSFGLSRLWFGVLFLTNAQLSFITPPFGFALFYMKSILPEDIKMSEIIRSVVPFMPLQLIGVILVMLFPEIALWLPRLMIGG
ncbi:TRAP transporter large permease subunit [Chloroflexota bacterium]